MIKPQPAGQSCKTSEPRPAGTATHLYTEKVRRNLQARWSVSCVPENEDAVEQIPVQIVLIRMIIQ